MSQARLVGALVGGVLALGGACAAFGQDYVSSPRTYYLHPPSSYQQGCWGPCACVLSGHEAMLGSFTLGLVTVGDATDFYSITDVNWRVPRLGGEPFNVALTGSGTFAAGQHPYNPNQHGSLDLTLNPAPPPFGPTEQFFITPESDTRTRTPPVIDVEYANSATGCPGIRLRLVASWYKTDWDASGTVAIADIFAFLGSWLEASPSADFDGIGGLTVTDIHEFLNAWFAGL